jgi:hypothetical protein
MLLLEIALVDINPHDPKPTYCSVVPQNVLTILPQFDNCQSNPSEQQISEAKVPKHGIGTNDILEDTLSSFKYLIK